MLNVLTKQNFSLLTVGPLLNFQQNYNINKKSKFKIIKNYLRFDIIIYD